MPTGTGKFCLTGGAGGGAIRRRRGAPWRPSKSTKDPGRTIEYAVGSTTTTYTWTHLYIIDYACKYGKNRAVIAPLNNRPAAVRERLRCAIKEQAAVAVSSIALYESCCCVARSARRRENAERLRVFLSGAVDVLAFEEEDSLAAGDLRALLEAAGTPIGPYDLLIAAQALRARATLVTANTAEFGRVRGLEWEDWTAQA